MEGKQEQKRDSNAKNGSYEGEGGAQDAQEVARLAEYERLKALGTDRFKDKKFNYAVKYYDQASSVIYSEGDSDPTRLSYYVVCKNNAAQCCINLQDFGGAVSYASEALSKDPKNAKAFYRRGIAYMALEENEEALSDLKSALLLDPGNNDVIERDLRKAADECLLINARDGLLDSEKLESLVKAGVNVNAKERRYGFTALIGVSQNGHLNIAELLLSNGANINDKTKLGGTALFTASQQGHVQIVDLLLSKGANINIKDMNHHGPLHVAIQKGFFDIVQLLLSKGASANDRCHNEWTPLMKAAERGYASIVELLLSTGANINDKSNDGTNALIISSHNGHVNVVELLLAKGADIKLTDNMGNNALMMAIRNGQARSCELLLTSGADVRHRNNTFSTSLMMACALDYVDIVKMLLCFGANRHDRTPERSTCLTMARSDKVKSLLKNWDVTMLMIVLQELLVLSALDPSSFIDLRKFLG